MFPPSYIHTVRWKLTIKSSWDSTSRSRDYLPAHMLFFCCPRAIYTPSIRDYKRHIMKLGTSNFSAWPHCNIYIRGDIYWNTCQAREAPSYNYLSNNIRVCVGINWWRPARATVYLVEFTVCTSLILDRLSPTITPQITPPKLVLDL